MVGLKISKTENPALAETRENLALTGGPAEHESREMSVSVDGRRKF